MRGKLTLLNKVIFLVTTCLAIPLRAVISQDLECPIRPFGTITISVAFQLNGPGQNIDSIDFWEAPDAARTLMFVTAKENSLLEVWEYPFKNGHKPALRHPTFSGSKVNGVVVDQDADRLYLAISEPSSTVSMFSLPHLKFQMNFNKTGANYQGEPNIALLKLQNGKKQVYVSADDIVYIHDADNGEYYGEFRPKKGLETMAADRFHQRLYIPDENDRTGIYVYHPDGRPYEQNGSNRFGQNVFDSDAEGIVIFPCHSRRDEDDGTGFIVVSDQRSDITEFEFFDRQSWEHLGTLKLKGVSNTDGIASIPVSLPGYPKGVFAAVDNDHKTAVVGWDVIFRAMIK